MQKNYAYECGAFMALAKMMRNKIRNLESDDEFTREWAETVLRDLADQTDATLAEFGYTGVDAQ
jgi:CelD/BcsL family acetyltransferase involved in cellulose biosynthesis